MPDALLREEREEGGRWRKDGGRRGHGCVKSEGMRMRKDGKRVRKDRKGSGCVKMGAGRVVRDGRFGQEAARGRFASNHTGRKGMEGLA